MNERLYNKNINQNNNSILSKMKKIRGKERTHAKVISVFLFKLYLLLLLPYISKEEENNQYIELIVKGPGNINIFNLNEGNNYCYGLIPPDEMQINNGEWIQNPSMIQYLNNEDNYIRLVWINKKIDTLHCLFHECNNIISADLSHINSTFVDSLNDLFNG